MLYAGTSSRGLSSYVKRLSAQDVRRPQAEEGRGLGSPQSTVPIGDGTSAKAARDDDPVDDQLNSYRSIEQQSRAAVLPTAHRHRVKIESKGTRTEHKIKLRTVSLLEAWIIYGSEMKGAHGSGSQGASGGDQVELRMDSGSTVHVRPPSPRPRPWPTSMSPLLYVTWLLSLGGNSDTRPLYPPYSMYRPKHRLRQFTINARE
jgi:hypothetical protein